MTTTPPEARMRPTVNFRDLLADFEEKRDALDDVIKALQRFIGVTPATAAAVEAPAAAALPPGPKRKYKRRKGPAQEPAQQSADTGKCDKHPDAGLTRSGECKQCKKAEYMRNWFQKKKKVNQNTQPAELPDPVTELETPQAPPPRSSAPEVEWVYSQTVKCPKCFIEGVRLRRRKDADPQKDVWTHVKTDGSSPCIIKMLHYNIKDARSQSAAAHA